VPQISATGVTTARVRPSRPALSGGIFPPPYLVLLIGLGVGEFYRESFEAAGILLDGTDVTFLAFAVSLMAFRLPREAWKFRPYMLLWTLLGTLLSLSYLVQPTSWEYFSSPAALGYQLYRYCWRPLLYYPLVLAVIRSRSKIEFALLALIAWADCFSLHAIWQGYFTDAAGVQGPFLTKNGLGSALIAPLAIAVAALLRARGPRWGLLLVSVLLMLRALVFAGSRGAFVAVVVACGVTGALAALNRDTRKRIVRLGVGAMAVLAIGLAARPDMLQRPAVQYLLEASNPTDVGTFQWRLHERWPFFFRIVKENPWFGVGSDVDVSLGQRANTPHNGYLALAVSYGVPAAMLYVVLLLIGVANGVSFVRRVRPLGDGLVVAGVVGGLVGFMVHNLVESSFRVSFVGPTCWLLVAICVSLNRRYGHAAARV
jgi:O-antigen ligase